ncbi:fluoride efflux transporter CrcB [Effusibacillus lacus]|uniref:fluoride efflux transporter CrcB n=1 Tax=Effusibacillus lacus TaxID=1348429 RepID=UPI000BB8EAB1|nr:fluoride efflux transporter CrcB [Effusibacillus lacus]TCS68948.1 camphor resistance protein CrcB [Effusibacillus lacus]
MNFIAVAAGGAVGSLARYVLALVFPIDNVPLFPWPTFLANVIGCFLIGLLFQATGERLTDHHLRLGLGTGLLGGFTTFSTFSLELIQMVRAGQVLLALSYCFASLAVSLAACYWGIRAIRTFQAKFRTKTGDAA